MAKVKLLYIEDDDEQRRSLTKRLRSKGFTVTPSKTGRAGLGMFNKRTFDAVLCDLNMPGIGGEKVLERVRRVNEDVPFILLSAHGTVSLAVKAIKKGADDFILKPADINDIAMTLQRAIERRGLEKSLKDSQEKLRIVTENIPDIIYSLGPRGEFLSLSASPGNDLGYSPEDLIGKSVLTVIHPEDQKHVMKGFQRSIASRDSKVRAISFRMVSKTGAVRHFEVNRRHMYEKGRFVQSVGVARDVTERIMLEEKLQEYSRQLERLLDELSNSKEELQAIIDAAPELLILVDTEGIVKAVNKRVSDYFGIAPAKVINSKFDDFNERIEALFEKPGKFRKIVQTLKAKPDIQDRIDVAEIFSRGIKVKSEKRLIISPMSVCVYDEGGNEIGRVWDYVNITSAIEADEQLHTIVGASPIPTIISRFEDGKVLFVNEQLASLVGTPADELLGRFTPDFYCYPEDREKIITILARDGYVKNFETCIKKADGTFFWTILSLVVTEIGGERVILGGLYDISERKKYEEALTRERNFVSAVLDTAGALIVVLDTQGRIVRFNRACEQVSGYTFSEVENRPLWDIFIVSEDMEEVRDRFDKLCAGQFPVRGENYWRTKDGNLRLISWSNTCLFGSGGTCEYIVGIGIDITEQREAEEKIKLYRELFINANDAIAIFDREGYFIERNPMHLGILGSQEDFIGKKFSELLGERGPEIEKKVFDSGEFRGELSVTGADGLGRTIDLSIFRIKKESGEVFCYAGIARDITQRKEAEKRIANRLRYEAGLAALSQSLLKESGVGDVLDDALGNLLHGARASRVYIFENFMDEVDGLCMRQTHEVCAPGVEPQIDNPLLQHAPYKEGFDSWRERLKQGESVGGLVRNLSRIEREILDPQGILSIVVIPITVAGHWYGFVGFDDVWQERVWDSEDVRTLRTAAEIIGIYIERRQFEEALRVSEERFRSLVENANDIIYSLSPEGDFIYVSPKATDILGYGVEELVGKSLFPMLHPDDREESIKWWRSGFEIHEAHVTGYEFRTYHKDGSIRWLKTKASPIYDEDGKVMMLIGVAHDITEMKRILNELEEANRTLKETQIQLVQSEKMASLGQLVAGIAHEINTPIGAVNSIHDTLVRAVEVLKSVIDTTCARESADRAKIDEMLKLIDDSNTVIKSGTERVTNIVRRLRSFARLDEAELKTVDIHEGLEDTLTLIHHEIKHDITVIKHYGDVPPVACYPGQLNQVFLNILINAKQAIKGKGEITITTFVENDKVHIAIKDTGTGIARERLGKVFDPGFTTKGVGIGTGLGLSICYQIMQVHKGEITVESELGKGSTFTIIFPINLESLIEEENVDKI